MLPCAPTGQVLLPPPQALSADDISAFAKHYADSR
jgi:hypothetical protein